MLFADHRAGRHAGPGDADDLWHDYEKVLDFVPELGFDGVRLCSSGRASSRAQARGSMTRALLRYGEVMRYARVDSDLDVTVAIVDARLAVVARPRGVALPWIVPLRAGHTRRVVERLRRRRDGLSRSSLSRRSW